MNPIKKSILLALSLLIFTPIAPAQLAVSPNGRHLVRQDGRPFYWLGDTGWALLQKIDREEVKFYLKARARQGFSVIHAAAVHQNPFVTPPLSNSYNDPAFIDDDPTRPAITPGNDPDDPEAYDYWDHIEYIINTADRYGLYINFLPVFNMAEGDGYNLLTPENAYEYGRFIGNRFKDKSNIIWCIGGDVLADNELRKSVWNLLAKGVNEGVSGTEDYTKTLMTFHTRGGHSSSDYFPDAEWLDFHMLQTWDSYTRIYDVVSADYRREPVKPILHGEGAYEDGPEYPTKPITPFVIRKQAYWAMFAGGLHTYGNSNVWSFGTNPKYVSADWKEAVFSPGAKQAGLSNKIMTAQRWWELIPDQSLILSGANDGNLLNAAMRSRSGDRILVYFSSETSLSLDLSRIGTTAPPRAFWINPQTGKKQKIGKLDRGQSSHTFTPPSGWEDALLVIRSRK
ncbi:apiosidase-like domain-containing protein [Flavilitoribacter nigricans]|uniref:DUF4038 domain-containing protein n=1 Tax=Flavilitoribacter nigricans (strain ATCC 23147 / DSM 23189 / NBRC 102662 / NCIMB 1420 / SS-2) TaxID=1122177 RepID=A0A2D0MZK5_FLAN2|nr:DUF4038 domain-containing protein [Flavilitoribacter nigricans]PHN01556.1 hypothetical protein CRP01_36255 [Flavilitoribacter nigricans DSM 23189 = NBRC 102662]